MATKFALTKAKQASNTKPVLRGKPLAYNAAVPDRYSKMIAALVRQMCAQTKKEVLRMYQTHASAAMDASVAAQGRMLVNDLDRRFAKLFGRKAPELANNMANGATEASKSALHASLKDLSGGLSIKTSAISPALREIISASVVENVALIKSIQKEYHAGVMQAVMRSVAQPDGGYQSLTDYLTETEGKTIRRADFIAQDQTRKVYNTVNAQRMQSLGIKKFEWVHSGGGQHPRRQHEEWDGQIFSFDKLPVDDQFGPVIPGQAINCRCVQAPVIELGEEDVT